MSATYAMPFLQAPPAAIEVSEWSVQTFDGHDWVELGAKLPGWDPLRTLFIRRSAIVDADAVKSSCQLHLEDRLRLCVIVWSRDAFVRRCLYRSEPLVSGTVQFPVACTIDGGDVAGEIEITTELVLEAPSASSHPFAPQMAGSRLWSHTHYVEIEGAGSQFPVEAGDFARMPWLPSQQAPWHLEIDASDLESPFLGSVRLFLNSSTPAMREIDKHPSVRSLINYDVARCLVLSIITDEMFEHGADRFPRRSLGAVVRNLARAFFPGMSIREIAEEARQRPWDLETRIRAATGLLNE